MFQLGLPILKEGQRSREILKVDGWVRRLMSVSEHKCDCGHVASSAEDLAKHVKDAHGESK